MAILLQHLKNNSTLKISYKLLFLTQTKVIIKINNKNQIKNFSKYKIHPKSATFTHRHKSISIKNNGIGNFFQ
jgi:hypothetical protein